MSYFSFIIGFLLSVGALYFALLNIPMSSLLEYISSVSYSWVFLSIVVNFISFLIRVYRWQIIVKEINDINFCSAYHPTAIAFMMNCILPGRVGELARPLILNQKVGTPITGGIATIVTERLFDVVILILLYSLVFFYVDIDPNYQLQIGDYTLSSTLLSSLAKHIFILFIFLLVFIVCISFQSIRSYLKKLLSKIPGLIFFVSDRGKNFLTSRCITPIINMIDHVAEGFSLLKHPKRIFHCFFLSIVIWLLIALSYYIFGLGCKNLNLNFFEMCAIMVMICFFISLPSVPGYWGLWEAGGLFGMTIFGVEEHAAMGFTLLNHVAQIIPIIIAGFISAALTGTSIFSAKKQQVIENIQNKE
ncbi:protein belonging to Lysylphosphatidylglycerol synthetase/UPF0104 [Candidatus Magnetomorum sp. HK-1]|nr:protein belonging to Lysylphosphatidylglycerol synthetase/UPF0104 [Candidatus Magnetomorum sp. HK-1]